MWRYTPTEELMHGHKYIKKVKTPYGYRYFYTRSEIDAYNKEKNYTVEPDPHDLEATEQYYHWYYNSLMSQHNNADHYAYTDLAPGYRNARYNPDKRIRLKPRKKVITGKADNEAFTYMVRQREREKWEAKRRKELASRKPWLREDSGASSATYYGRTKNGMDVHTTHKYYNDEKTGQRKKYRRTKRGKF